MTWTLSVPRHFIVTRVTNKRVQQKITKTKTNKNKNTKKREKKKQIIYLLYEKFERKKKRTKIIYIDYAKEYFHGYLF